MKRQNTWLPDPDYAALIVLSKKRDLAVPDLVRKAVADLIEKARVSGELRDGDLMS